MKPYFENSKIDKRPFSSYKTTSSDDKKSEGNLSTREYKNEYSHRHLSKEKEKKKERELIIINSATFKKGFMDDGKFLRTENIYEEFRQLKSTVNIINKELTLIKSELHRKEIESKRFMDILRNNTANKNQEKFQKIEENYVYMNLKKEFYNLRREFEKREKEIKELKNSLSFIRLKEMQMENQILRKEKKKLKIINQEDIEKDKNSNYKNFTLPGKFKNQSGIVEKLYLQNSIVKEDEMENSNRKEISKSNYPRDYNFKQNEIKETSDIIKSDQINRTNNLKLNYNQRNSFLPAFKSSNWKKLRIKYKDGESYHEINCKSNMKRYKTTNLQEKVSHDVLTNPFLTTKSDVTSEKADIINLMTNHQMKIYTIVFLNIMKNKPSEKSKFKQLISLVLSKSFSYEEFLKYIKTILNINSQREMNLVKSYYNTLDWICSDNNLRLKNKLLYLLDDNKIIPSQEKLNKYKEKFQKKIKKNLTSFTSLFDSYIINKRETITLENLEHILFTKNIQLKLKDYKLIIYIMKNDTCLELDELNYKNLLDFIPLFDGKVQGKIEKKDSITYQEKEPLLSITNNSNGRIENGNNSIEILQEKKEIYEQRKCNNHSSIIENVNEDNNYSNNNDEDVIMTVKEFDQTVDRILQRFADYLINFKKTVKEFFANKLIQLAKPNLISEAILLKDFVDSLRQINIDMNTIDVYCVFSKLKLSEDDDEMIDIYKLSDEMLNYGIFEETVNNIWNGNTSIRKPD